MINDETHFEASDLSEVKSLLKSLDLEVETISDANDEDFTGCYNTYHRPDKEGSLQFQKNKTATIQAIVKLLKDRQKVEIFWDADNDKILVQILVNGQPHENLERAVSDEIIAHEIMKLTSLFVDNQKNNSKGQGELSLNAFRQIRLQYSAEVEYFDEDKMEQADLWENVNAQYIQDNRAFENSLPFAEKFQAIKRGFQAEINLNDAAPDIDFYFAPSLDLNEEEATQLANLLSLKINLLTQQQRDFKTNSERDFMPLLINGQLSDKIIAILSFEAKHFVQDTLTDQTILFEKE